MCMTWGGAGALSLSRTASALLDEPGCLLAIDASHFRVEGLHGRGRGLVLGTGLGHQRAQDHAELHEVVAALG